MMIVLRIILGLLGLGVVVFFHELGHFICARLGKIEVEAFSIGWGNPILKKKIGKVEYRLGMFPVGGYCKFKGENDYKEAWNNMKNGIMPEKGSYLAASPAARILACFGGPFFNLVLSVLLLSLLWGIGFEINTLGNRVILASEIDGDYYPADSAGFKTGDRIIAIAGKDTSYYYEVQENIALNPDREIPVTVERDGRIVQLRVTPALDKTTGTGKIGVYFWNDPVIGNVTEGGAAFTAGLRENDIIRSVNGIPVRNTMDFSLILDNLPDELNIEYSRNETASYAYLDMREITGDIGFSWSYISVKTPSLPIPAAIAKGIQESWKSLTISISSLRVLFMGVDLTQAVSGPVRITYMMGDIAAQGFREDFGTGLRSIMEFIALISIALCVMNLLPLPVLDGGMIILFLVELIRGKPAHPKAISIFQTCGFVIIFGLMIFALFGDILFLVRN